MKRLLSFFIVLGFLAGAIALVIAFWPVFVGLAVLSALVLGFFEWHRGAPARAVARSEREWAKYAPYDEEGAARDEERVQRALRLKELSAEAEVVRDRANAVPNRPPHQSE